MYKPIHLDQDVKISNIDKHMSMDIFTESKKEEQSIFTEAVFNNGREKLSPLLSVITSLKNELTSMIEEKGNNFSPEDFWRSQNFKSLEDTIKDIFGFRYVSVMPYNEKYVGNGEFESHELNCSVSRYNRYPIDGIVTDNGFYDNTHSLVMDISLSTGCIFTLEPEEILAVFLHEFGHGIDPAIVDIKYSETNILSKYLTERTDKLTESEQQVVKNKYKIISRFVNIFKFKKKRGIK